MFSLRSAVMRYPLSCRITFCLLLLLAATLASAPAFAQANLRIEPHLFETRDGRTAEAELGRFDVPANRRDGSDEMLELAFIRFPSTSDTPGAPIVYLAGGPGGSGSGTAAGSRFDLFMALREVADVIAFDQRGTGLSEKTPHCPYEWSFPTDQPATRAGLVEAVAAYAERCEAFWEKHDVDLSAYNTNESADDLEALRAVLGAEKLNLWGISYGTHLGLTMLRRHGERIERAVLAGVEGPDHTLKLPSNVQAAIERTDSLVQAQGKQALIPRIERILERLEQAPARVHFTDPDTDEERTMTISAFDVQWVVSVLLRGPSYQETLVDVVAEMEVGNFSQVAPIIYDDMHHSWFGAMSAAMDAASGATPARLARIEREREQMLLGDAINFPYLAEGDILDVPDLGPEFRGPVQSEVPTLFISGTGDGRTPPSNADEVLEGFSRGAHLVIEGAGHGDDLFLSSPEILETMRRFLLGEAVESRFLDRTAQDQAARGGSESGADFAAEIDALMIEAHERGILNGSVLVARGGEVLYESEFGYADANRTVALTPAHRFNIGSISKEFSAVGIMMLAEEGLVDLDHAIARYLPALPEWAETVPVQHLLDFTSGLPRLSWDGVGSDADLIDRLRAVESLEHEPGAGYIYSFYNVFLRHRIIEAVSGQSYPDFLREEIVSTCSMDGTVIDPGTDEPLLADAFDNAFVADTLGNPLSGTPFLSVTDLFRWTRCLHSGQLIAEASLLRLTQAFGGGQSALGHQQVVDGELRWHAHHGSSYNYEALYYNHLAEDFTVALVTNNKNMQVGDLAMAVQAILNGEAYETPKKSLYLTLRTKIYHDGLEEGLAFFRKIRSSARDRFDFSDEEDSIDDTGRYLMRKGRLEDAIAVFELNTSLFPESADAHARLADTYLEAERQEKAIGSYRRALELDPANDDARGALAKLTGAARHGAETP